MFYLLNNDISGNAFSMTFKNIQIVKWTIRALV